MTCHNIHNTHNKSEMNGETTEQCIAAKSALKWDQKQKFT